MDPDHQTEVIILTRSYRVRGNVALVPGARLTDFVKSADLFIAVTDAVVTGVDGKQVLKARFLNVGREQIELILPAEFAEML